MRNQFKEKGLIQTPVLISAAFFLLLLMGGIFYWVVQQKDIIEKQQNQINSLAAYQMLNEKNRNNISDIFEKNNVTSDLHQSIATEPNKITSSGIIKNNENLQNNEKSQQPQIEQPLLIPKDIDLQSIVSIYCEFEDKFGKIIVITRGSGVIIDPNYGYILTNRHVVDQIYTNWVYGDSDNIGNVYLKNNECKIYFFDNGESISYIPQKKYSFYDINAWSGNYDFTAQLVLVPSTNDGFSISEIANLDFALLKFKEWDTAFKYSFGRKPPSSLHYSPIFSGSVPLNEELVIPGFATQVIGDEIQTFDTSRLTIKNGILVGKTIGDQKYADETIELTLKYDPDMIGGRSGSPIFWKGYIVGLLKTGWAPNSKSEYLGTESGYLEAPQDSIIPIAKYLLEKHIPFTNF